MGIIQGVLACMHYWPWIMDVTLLWLVGNANQAWGYVYNIVKENPSTKDSILPGNT